MIKYIGRNNNPCDVCGEHRKNQHLYLDNKHMVKALFPEYHWTEQVICEKCAKRGVGIKKWTTVKRR